MIILFWIFIFLSIVIFLFHLIKVILAKFPFKENSQLKGVSGEELSIFTYLFSQGYYFLIPLIGAFLIYIFCSFVPSIFYYIDKNNSLPEAKNRLSLYESYYEVDPNFEDKIMSEKLNIIKIETQMEGLENSQLFFWVK